MMKFILKLTSHSILHHLRSADILKRSSKLIMSTLILPIFFNGFCPVEKCGVTPHYLYIDSLNLKLMKRAPSCKYRKIIKLCNARKSCSNINYILKMRWEICDFNTSEDDAQHGTSSYCLKTKVKLTFFLSYHHGDTNTAFQLKLANFLATQLPFMIV